MNENATPPHTDVESVWATGPTLYRRRFVLSKTTVLKNPDCDCEGEIERVIDIVPVPERLCVSDAVVVEDGVEVPLVDPCCDGDDVTEGVVVPVAEVDADELDVIV